MPSRNVAKKRGFTSASPEAVAAKIAVEEETPPVPATAPNPAPCVAPTAKSFKQAAHASKCVKPETNKPRIVKNLKQVITAERLYPSGIASYGSIEMHQTLKPAKKYSDISGLPAKYTDPHTKLYYSNSEEFARIRCLAPNQILGLLSLRRANVPMN